MVKPTVDPAAKFVAEPKTVFEPGIAGWEPLAARSNSAARPAIAVDEGADEEIRSNGN